MSDLPEIDYPMVAKKLSNELGLKFYQVSQLEVLAEALKTERDTYKQELDQLRARTADAV